MMTVMGIRKTLRILQASWVLQVSLPRSCFSYVVMFPCCVICIGFGMFTSDYGAAHAHLPEYTHHPSISVESLK